MGIEEYAEDVFESKEHSKVSELIGDQLPCCDYCGGERKKSLLSIIGAHRLCESWQWMRDHYRNDPKNEVKNSQLEECPDSKVSCDDHQWNARTNRITELSDATSVMGDLEECPSKYDGSLWEYFGEGFRVSWDGHKWNARCTKPLVSQSIFEDVDPVAMEIEGFWNLIE